MRLYTKNLMWKLCVPHFPSIFWGIIYYFWTNKTQKKIVTSARKWKWKLLPRLGNRNDNRRSPVHRCATSTFNNYLKNEIKFSIFSLGTKHRLSKTSRGYRHIATLQLMSMTRSDAGAYRCVLENNLGKSQAELYLHSKWFFNICVTNDSGEWIIIY